MAQFKFMIHLNLATLICLSMSVAHAAGAKKEEGSCDDPVTPAAREKFEQCTSNIKVGAGVKKGLIVDADSNRAWFVDVNGSGKAECFKIGVGAPSNGGKGKARLGNGHGSNLTPPGLMMSFNKGSGWPPPFTDPKSFVGLKGTYADNNASEGRGILLHSCWGYQATQGCICFKGPMSRWQKVQKLIAGQEGQKNTPVFVYAKSMRGAGCQHPKKPDKPLQPSKPLYRTELISI